MAPVSSGAAKWSSVEGPSTGAGVAVWALVPMTPHIDLLHRGDLSGRLLWVPLAPGSGPQHPVPGLDGLGRPPLSPPGVTASLAGSAGCFSPQVLSMCVFQHGAQQALYPVFSCNPYPSELRGGTPI